MAIKVKNRTDQPQFLVDSEGESIQINAHALASVEETFLVSYDRMKIQIVDKVKPIITTPNSSLKEEIVTTPAVEITMTDANVSADASDESKSKSKSK